MTTKIETEHLEDFAFRLGKLRTALGEVRVSLRSIQEEMEELIAAEVGFEGIEEEEDSNTEPSKDEILQDLKEQLADTEAMLKNANTRHQMKRFSGTQMPEIEAGNSIVYARPSTMEWCVPKNPRSAKHSKNNFMIKPIMAAQKLKDEIKWVKKNL